MYLKAFNSSLSSSCSHCMGQHMVTFTEKQTLTLFPVGIPWGNCQKASKAHREGSLCGRPCVCSDTTSATRKFE